VDFRLDPQLPGAAWTHVFDTQEARGHVRPPAYVLHPGGTFSTGARSLALFQLAPT
jgi:hypothetical protein